MKIKMRVVTGERFQDAYQFPAGDEPGDEPDDILVGREDVSCKAHWRLGPKDVYVSRAHFLLEVRPPNVHIQDNMSKNGTYLRRPGQPETRVIKESLQDGDQLRIGETVVAFEIESEKPVRTRLFEAPVGTKVYPTPPEPRQDSMEDFFCVRCGAQLETIPPITCSLRDLDFMCDRCRQEMDQDRIQQAEAHAGVQFFCDECGREVTGAASRDGRAVELLEVATYLCEDCFKEALAKGRRGEVPLPQDDFGGYTAVRFLGKGGMGEVYKACHEETGRIAAVKLTLPIAQGDEELLLRFHREISIMQSLVHPNLVRLYGAGQAGDCPYFISEFVPGGDMAKFIDKDGRTLRPPEEVTAILAESLVGLAHFHRGPEGKKEVRVHRDLKPENILLRPKNGHLIPKIADFGLSKSYEEHGGFRTKTGTFCGTWMYMPPEQITNFKRATPRVDVYAMGASLYYLLTGLSPLPEFPPPWEIIKKEGNIRLSKPLAQMVLHDRRVPLAERRPGLPAALCRAVDKALSMNADDRFSSAEEFRRALLAV